MSFDFEIVADPTQAVAASQQVEAALQSIAQRAQATGQSISVSLSAGTSDAAKAIGNVGDAAHSSLDGVEAMGAALEGVAAAVGLAFGAHEIVSSADEYVQMSNRLRAVATDQANLNAIMDETFRIAQATRTGWEDIVNVFNRVSKSASDMGLSQRQVANITQELAQATKISGATQAEAAMSMNELTHAFSIGTLTGREFRVLAKDMPQLLTDLAAAAGMTRSQFVEMGMRGRVTAQELVDYLGKAAPQIAAEFARTMPTIADSLTMVHNAAIKFFGEAGQGTGVMRDLTTAIQFVADHFATFAKAILGVLEPLAALFVIQKIITLVQLLGAVIAANPIGALITVAVIAVNVLREFGDEINLGTGHLYTLGDVLRVVWGDIREFASAIAEFVSGAWHELMDAFSDGINTDGIELSLRNVLLFFGSFVDAAVGLGKMLYNNLVPVFGGLAVVIGDAFVQLFQALAKLFADFINKVIDGANYLGDKIYDNLNDTSSKRAAAIAAARAETAQDVIRAQNRAGDAAAAGVPAGSRPIDTYFARAGAGVSKDQESAMYQSNLRSAYIDQGLTQTGEGNRENRYGHVDFAFNNPLEGSKDALGKLVGDGIKSALSESTVKDYISSVFDRAAASVHKMDPAGSVSDAAGQAGTPPVTKEQEAAAEKMLKELRGIVEQSNQVTAAQEKLAHAQTIVDDAMRAGSGPIADMLQKYGGGAAIMEAYRKRLQDQLDPFGALVDKTIKATAAMRDNADEQARATQLERDVTELKSKGVTVTENQTRYLQNLIRIEQEHHKLMSEEQALYTQIVGPGEKYALATKALNDMWEKGTIDNEQYTRAVDQQRLAYLNASGAARTMEGGVEAAFLRMKDQASDVGAQIGKIFTGVFDDISKSIVDLVTGAKVDWKGMVDALLADLTRLLLNQAFMAIVGGASGPSGGGGGGLNLGSIGSAAAGAVLGGAAFGGAFDVGGSGGIDSQIVAFRATPGERVSINTPGGGGPASPATNSRFASGGRSQVNVHMHMSPHDLLRGVDSPEGEEVVSNMTQRTVGAMVGVRSRNRGR